MTLILIGVVPPISCVLVSPTLLLIDDTVAVVFVEDVFVAVEVEKVDTGTSTTLFQLGCFFTQSGSKIEPTNLL